MNVPEAVFGSIVAVCVAAVIVFFFWMCSKL